MAHSLIPQLRIPKFDYTNVPVDWMASSPLATCLGNALHIMFPAGERFFIRSVMHYKEQLRKDPQLWPQVRGFAGQEGQHGHQHELVFDKLREQGVPVDSFLRAFEGFAFGFLEKTIADKRVHLATTVAVEHFTATLARLVLAEPEFLDGVAGEMRDLLHWHAMEELEHQYVTWDVLQEIDRSYPRRVLGMMLASLVVGGFWFGGGLYFAAKSGVFTRLSRAELGAVKKTLPLAKIGRSLLEYYRPDYQPGKPGDEALLEAARERYRRDQARQSPLAEAA